MAKADVHPLSQWERVRVREKRELEHLTSKPFSIDIPILLSPGRRWPG
jgi:hypothetical protein